MRLAPTLLALSILAAGCVALPYESTGGLDPEFPAPPQLAPAARDADPRDVGSLTLAWGGSRPETQAAMQEEVEAWVAALDRDLILPSDIRIVHTSCGIENAYYSPDERTVYLCWELLDVVAQVMSDPSLSQDEVERAVGSAWLFVLFHELGHALVDAYDLPITGREEDAVDDLATLELIDAGASNAAVEAAIFWILTDDQQYSQARFMDEHSLNPQRFYAILCTVYGSDPESWAAIVEYGYLTPERAQRCAYEYPKKDAAWDTLLAPWRVAGDAQA